MSKQTDNYLALAPALGLRYDPLNQVLYGQRNGYDILIYAANPGQPYLLTIHTGARNMFGANLTKEQTKELTKSVKPILTCLQNGNDIVITVNAATGAKVSFEKLTANTGEALNALTSFLYGKGFAPCCSICGMQKFVAPHELEGRYYHLCPDCETSMRTRIAAPKPQKQENVIGGIVGALLGSLIGVFCIVLLSQLGYVAAFSGVAMAIGVLAGYEKLGGKLTKKGIVISIVIMLGMTFAGNQLDWAISLYTKGGGSKLGLTIFDCFRMVPWAISNGVIKKSTYIFNLVLIYLFLLVGAIPTINAKIKDKQKIGRMVRIGSVGPFNNNSSNYMQ
ncbi:MAG: hypothetical protein HDR15_12720 [Lachnospiraceae bacterium]|nr:hypothetical protein [Lachnospiraceae bacterium]